MPDQQEKDQNQMQPQFDASQYEMLIRCSERKNMTEWNEWRMDNEDCPILLEGALLGGSYLEKAMLQDANLGGADLKNASLFAVHLEYAYLNSAHLEGADLRAANLDDAHLYGAHLEGANLNRASLKGVDLIDAHLEGAYLIQAHLEGAELLRAHLESAKFGGAVVDGATLLFDCTFNEMTEFVGVGLATARIDPGLRQELEGIVRRLNWLKWYEKHRFLKFLVQGFWLMSDYGRSTSRVILSIFLWALFFASIYYVLGSIDYYLHDQVNNPGIVKNLFTIDIDPIDGRVTPVKDVVIPFRALYFSIVTMTTLGFGDMAANPESIVGHVILAIQVLMGYVLLGVLVTRFAVLFTSGGPGESRSKSRSWQPEASSEAAE